jgi:CheY-like chemotaxis protein
MANKVLIVDDDQTLCDMYAERLKAEGFEVAVAHNGEEGTAKAIEFMPDVILLDIMMPKVNGFNTLEILKSTEQTKNIPVFLLTALIQEENKRRGIQSGAEDYIIKSETMPGAIIEKIKAVIKKKANPQESQDQQVASSVSPTSPTPPQAGGENEKFPPFQGGTQGGSGSEATTEPKVDNVPPVSSPESQTPPPQTPPATTPSAPSAPVAPPEAPTLPPPAPASPPEQNTTSPQV